MPPEIPEIAKVQLSLLDFTASAPYVVLHKTIRAPLAGTPTAVSANPAMSDHRVSCQSGGFTVDPRACFLRRDWPDCSQVHTAHRTR